MKKVLVSLAIAATFAACSDSTTKTDVKKDSTGTGFTTTPDSSKVTTVSSDSSHKADSTSHKVDTTHK